MTKDIYRHLFGGMEYLRYAIRSGKELRLTISSLALLVSCFLWMYSEWFIIILLVSACTTINLSARGVNTSLDSFRAKHAAMIINRESNIAPYLAQLGRKADSTSIFTFALSIAVSVMLATLVHSYFFDALIHHHIYNPNQVIKYQEIIKGIVSPSFDASLFDLLRGSMTDDRSMYSLIFYFAVYPLLFLVFLSFTETVRPLFSIGKHGAAMLRDNIEEEQRKTGG